MSFDIRRLLNFRDWDSLYHAVLVVATLVTAGFALVRYVEALHQQTIAAQMEARKPFSLKQLEIYEKLSELTADVAVPSSPIFYEGKKEELDRLVNGPLALVADGCVSYAVTCFYKCIDTRGCEDRMKLHLARHVAYACRNSLSKAWDVNLENLFQEANYCEKQTPCELPMR